MSTLKTVLEILRRLPGLITLATSVFSWLKELFTRLELKKASKEMDKAAENAKRTKDTRAIEDIYKGGGTP